MIRDVNLIDYLPPFLQDYRELTLVTDTENVAFQELANESERSKNNQFILSADDEGLKKFESLLNIHAAKDESIATRRSRVMSRWNDISPYTFHALISKLISLHDGDNFIINKKYDQYEIEIITHLDIVGQVEELVRMLDYIMPANLVVDSKNRIYGYAEGSAFVVGGFAYSHMFGLTDAYKESFTVNGQNLMGTGHSYVSLVNLSDAYEEALNAQGNAEIGSVYGGVASVTLSDAYHESFLSNGNAETANGLANVQKISVTD